MYNINETINVDDFSYIIRYSKAEDFEQVFEIWFENQAYSTNRVELKNKELLKQILEYQFLNQDNNFKFWIAEYNNIIIGYQSSNRTESNPVIMNEHAESSTYVSKNYYGKNIGYNLMKKCLEDLIETEITLFYGKILSTNIGMIKIVEKLGWIKIGETPQSNKIPIFPKCLIYVYNVNEKL